MSACSASIASRVTTSSAVPCSRIHGQIARSSPSWWWWSCSEKTCQRAASRCQVARSVAGVFRAATTKRSRSRRNAWWRTYIICMSTGPSGAAVCPGRNSWVGQSVWVLVLTVVLLLVR